MTATARNIRLYPWFKFFQNLLFWQAIWFLFFQNSLSASEAILLYAVYDLATTVLEVPSGYASDRFGRRPTLLVSMGAGLVGMLCFVAGDSFAAFCAGQICLGASAAFASGTDSAFLFESLAAENRAEDIEAEELTAFRATFAGLALSAVIGGGVALWSFTFAFVLSAVAFAAAFGVVLRFCEPPHHGETTSEAMRLDALKGAFRVPVLVWLFGLGVLMYGFSHIPFVYGQPYIEQALDRVGLAAEAPLVSGAVTAVMMILSLGASLLAPVLRRRIGLGPMLLLAFGMQVGLAAALALTNSVQAIVFLFLRMVPSSLSQPFIVARIQPLLGSAARATFLSLKSLVGRLLFAASLWVAAMQTSDIGQMDFPEIRLVLGWYVAVGLVALLALGLAARRVGVELVRAEPGP
jgi:MFS family permease